jgi:hypothetical protein
MNVTGWTTIFFTPPAGITFLNRAFTEPTSFHATLPPVASGIYAILTHDPSCKPRPYRAIYFGESSNFSATVTDSHEFFNDWVREAGGIANTYVAFCATPFLREEQRRWAENDLILRYRPVCNLKGNIAPALYYPLLGIAK